MQSCRGMHCLNVHPVVGCTKTPEVVEKMAFVPAVKHSFGEMSEQCTPCVPMGVQCAHVSQCSQ
jgi:hypothetical protein